MLLRTLSVVKTRGSAGNRYTGSAQTRLSYDIESSTLSYPTMKMIRRAQSFYSLDREAFEGNVPTDFGGFETGSIGLSDNLHTLELYYLEDSMHHALIVLSNWHLIFIPCDFNVGTNTTL